MHRFPTVPAPVRTGFTLMELLVVISIIMLLMGMLFAGIRMAKDSAARAKTQATISQLVASCENYRQVNGRYPEGTVLLEAEFVPMPYSKAYEPASKSFPTMNWGKVNAALVDALNQAGESFKAPVLDAWKKPIQYRPARYYPYISAAPVRIDSEDPPNRDSFQMWSIGKNTTDEAGEINTDDVTSWTK